MLRGEKMKPRTRRTAQLLLAIIIFVLAVSLIWVTDSGLTEQHKLFNGCWPKSTIVDNQAVLTVDFWMTYVDALRLNPISRFIYSRTRHHILLYLIGLCSIIGWSGSIFLQIVRTKPKDTAGWDSFWASFFLAALSGAVVFLLFVSSRLLIDTSGKACISEGYSYLAAAGGIASGMFVVLFFEWFESIAKWIWGHFGNPNQGEAP